MSIVLWKLVTISVQVSAPWCLVSCGDKEASVEINALMAITQRCVKVLRCHLHSFGFHTILCFLCTLDYINISESNETDRWANIRSEALINLFNSLLGGLRVIEERSGENKSPWKTTFVICGLNLVWMTSF